MKTASTRKPVRLVIVDSDPGAASRIREAFDERDVRVIGEANDIASGMRFIRGLQPDVALIELPEAAGETIEAMQQIRGEQPDIGIILSQKDPTPQTILGSMRAGAQEFVGRPIDTSELEKAIGHVDRQMARSVPVSARGNVISVFSCKGGVGGTSVAANLALALNERTDSRTALVDLSLQMGDLGLMLNQTPRYSLSDALVDDRLDEARLRSVLTKHEAGVDILTVATSPELAEDVNRDHMVDLFGLLSGAYDYVVVDVGRQLDDRVAEVLDLSDVILLLSTLDVPAVRNASRYMGLFDRLDIDRDKIRLVVNRFHKKTRLGLKDIEAALGMGTFWSIPNDYQPVSMGIDHGTPAVLMSRRSKVARSFHQLAAAIGEGREAPLPDASMPEQVEPQPMRKPHQKRQRKEAQEAVPPSAPIEDRPRPTADAAPAPALESTPKPAPEPAPKPALEPALEPAPEPTTRKNMRRKIDRTPKFHQPPELSQHVDLPGF